VATDDVVAEGVGIELLGLDVVTGEAALGVGDEDTTVGGTLHGSEDTVTGGGADETNIKEGLEGAALAIVGLDGLGESVLTSGLLDTLELLSEAEHLYDQQLLIDAGELLQANLRKIEVRLQRARTIIKQPPGSAAALVVEVLRDLELRAAAGRNASEGP